MDATTLIATLQAGVPGVRVESAPSADSQTTISVSRDEWPALARLLRDQPDLRFDFLAELTAVDFWPRAPRFELVCLLVSLEHRARLRVKVPLNADDAHIGSVIAVWPAANWLEREVWDLFGIVFDGHPDLRRLLMPEDWDGHPLRKDYPVQIRMAARTAEPLQVTEAQFRASVEHDRLSRR
jgi:NADH-quinone oxidoreductase subunit C